MPLVGPTQDEKARFIKGNELKLTEVELLSSFFLRVCLQLLLFFLGRNVRVWKQLPSNILFSGNIAVSRDPRVSLVNDSLQIARITPAYAGDYVCQISKHPNLNVAHKIFVNGK